MARYIAFRNGNKTDEHGLYRLVSKLFTGDVITGLATTQAVSPNMTVLVTAGDCLITDTNYKYEGWSDATETLTITTADSTNPRIDTVVIYVDKSVVDTTNSNSPTALKMIVVAGTPSATPTSASAGTIQTAVGASNPYIIVSYVRVNAGVTSIVNANITDVRKYVQIANTTSSAGSYIADNVESGGVVAQTTLLNASVSDIIYWVGGIRYIIKNIPTQTFTANKDTYVDITAGSDVLTLNAVNNGVASPTLSAGTIRIAKVVTNGTTITSITQDGADSQGASIYNNTATDLPGRKRAVSVSLKKAGGQVVSAATWTKVTNFQVHNNTGGFNYDGTNHRLYLPYTGVYRVVYCLTYMNSGSASDMLISLSLNSAGGTGNRGWIRGLAGASGALTLSRNFTFSAGDYLEFGCYLTGTVPTINGGDYTTTGTDSTSIDVEYLGN